MAQGIMISEKVVEAVNDLQERLYAKHWREHSRASFVYSLVNSINSLNEIKELLHEAKTAFDKEGKNVLGLLEHAEELGRLLMTLEQNNDLEQARIRKAKERGIELLADDITTPELYSDLEQKVLGFILKTRFLIERLSIAERKEFGYGYAASKSTKKVLELLHDKESELQELRKKYEEIKNRHFLARLEEKTSHDIEKELNIASKKIEGEQKILDFSVDSFRKGIEQLQQSYISIREKMRSLEELNSQMYETVTEFTTTLKKERDYAKKIVLDIENETMRLRNSYSSQILAIEEEKGRAKTAAQEEQRKKISSMAKMLGEKDELVKNLKEIISAKDKHIQILEQQKTKNKPREKHGKN